MKSKMAEFGKEALKYLLYLVVFAGFFGLFVKLFGVTLAYENVDDYWLKLISSGELSGEPEAHLVYISLVGGWFLKLFNVAFPGISWYGVWMLGLYLVSFAAALYGICGNVKPLWGKAIVVAVFEGLFVSFLFVASIFVQYTTVTIVVAGVAVVLYLTGKKAGSTILYVIALTVRIKGALMVLPIFGILVLVDLLRSSKADRTKIVKWGAITAAICIIVLGVEFTGRNFEPWKSFFKYNTSRENIVDYNAFPDYEANSDLYEQYGISYESYVAAATRQTLLFDRHFNADSMSAIAAVNGKHDPNDGIVSMLKAFITRHVTSYMDRPLNLIVYCLYFLTLLGALLTKQKDSLWELAALFAGRMVIWAYLIWIDRIPTRVSQGVFAVEMLYLMAVFAKEIFSEKLTRKVAIFACVAIFLVAGVSLKWGLPYARKMASYNIERKEFNENLSEVREYLAANPDSFYILDSLSFLYYSEPLICKNEDDASNWIFNGYWPSNSPWSDKRIESLGYSDWTDYICNAENVRFVFADNDSTDWEYFENYVCKVCLKNGLEECDRFSTHQGFTYIVLKIY